MKRNVVFFLILFFISTFFIFPVLEEKIQLKEKKAFKYAFIEGRGSFNQMPDRIKKFIDEFFKQGLTADGPVITVYFNSPEMVAESELKWRVGFQVRQGVKVRSPLKLDTYQKKTVLEFLHKGSYESLPQVYNKLLKYGKEHSLEFLLPSYEFYLNSPLEVKAQELLTRIELPVKKAQ